MSLLADSGEKLVNNYTPAERRGREVCVQVRVAINAMRAKGFVPKRVWIHPDVAADMMALWQRMAGDNWDGVLHAAIAGVPMEVGSTGGLSWDFEHYENRAEAEMAHLRSSFQHVDNPLQGTH